MYKFHLQNCLWIPIDKKKFGAKMATSGKFQSEYNSKLFKKPVLLQALQVQFKYWTYPIVQFPLPKCPCIQASRTNFWHQNGYFWKVSIQSTNNSKPLKKKQVLFKVC